MKKYTFLLKPAFFVFSVFFAAWLTLKIEKLSPSDFGSHKSLFEKEPQIIRLSRHSKVYLRNLFSKYKTGMIDSVKLDHELETFLESSVDTCSSNEKKANF